MKENIHLQPGEERYAGPGSLSNSAEPIVRRMVMEALPALARWAETQDALTKQMVQATARRKGLYEQGENWETVLEDFVRKRIEILRLKNPIDFPKVMATGISEATTRLQEMGEAAAEDTLLILWHQSHGTLALSWPGLSGLPQDIQPQRKLFIPCLGENAVLWAWDKRNFPGHNSPDA